MFIESYYDERYMGPTSSREPAIPYPELVGEELSLWQRYLPVRTELGNVPWLYDNTPHVVSEELDKARKSLCLFERIEIWSRSGDPMAVGVIGGEQTRYFSIARWGDAKLTLEQVKKRLRVEKWMFSLVAGAMILIFAAAILVLITHYDQLPELAQTALSDGGF